MAGNDLKLQVLLNAVDRVTGPMKKILGGTNAAAKALRAAQGELKKLNAVQDNIDGFRKLETQLGQTSNKLTTAQRDLRRLSDQVNTAEAPSKKLTAALKKQAATVGKLRELETKQRTALAGSKRALDAAGVSTSRLAIHERNLKADIAQANRAIDLQRNRLGKLATTQQRAARMRNASMKLGVGGAGALAAGAAVTRATAAPVSAYAEQEEAAVQLRASMMQAGGKVAPEFARIDALAKRLGNRLPGTTSDMLEMMTMLRRQGMSAQVILGGLGEATGYLGAQLRMPYTEAAEFAAKLQDATRATEGEMMGLADTIQRTYYLGVDADNMLQGFTKLSPALGILRMKGLEATKSLAPLLVMADQAGMQGEAAGNAYRKVFQYALDAKKLAKANAELKGTGISLDFSNGKGEFGGLDQMFAQLQKLKGVNTQERLAVIKKLFGDDAETLQVVSLMIDKGAAGYAQVQQKMAAQASLQQRVNAQLGTLKALWEAASGTFTNALATIGESVAPELKALTEWLGRVAEKFQVWVSENPKLAGGLFKIAAVLGVVLAAAGALALMVAAVLAPFAGLQVVLAAAAPLFTGLGGALMGLGAKILPLVATGVRAIGMAITANPIGIALMLIAGLAYVIYRNWDFFGPWFKKLWDFIKQILSWSPLGLIIANWGAIRAYFLQLWDSIKLYVSGAWNFITGIFSGDGSKIRAGLEMMWTAINNVLGGWPAKFLQFGINLIQGLINGIKGMAGAVKDAVVGSVTGAVDRFKAFLQIRSPSRLFAQFGAYTMQGFAGGLQRSQHVPLQRLSAFGGRFAAAGVGVAMAAAAAPAVAIDKRPPLSPAAAVAPAAGPAYNITINATPGSQAQDIATLVRLEIERIERERGARTRSRLGDYD